MLESQERDLSIGRRSCYNDRGAVPGYEMSGAGTMDDHQEEYRLGEDKGEGGTVTAKRNARGQEMIGGKISGENKEGEELEERMKEDRMEEESIKNGDTESRSQEDRANSRSNVEVKSGRKEENGVLEMRIDEEDDDTDVRDDNHSEKKMLWNKTQRQRNV